MRKARGGSKSGPRGLVLSTSEYRERYPGKSTLCITGTFGAVAEGKAMLGENQWR